jgi:hypothetical protein
MGPGIGPCGLRVLDRKDLDFLSKTSSPEYLPDGHLFVPLGPEAVHVLDRVLKLGKAGVVHGSAYPLV